MSAGIAGTATVEAAIALLVLVSVMVLCVAAVAAAMANLRCIDAASAAARLAARGDPQAPEPARRLAPTGADIEVDTGGEVVVARVTYRVPILSLSVEARAVAATEPRSSDEP